jgi:hypothetical protein
LEAKMTNLVFGSGAVSGAALLVMLLAPLVELAARVVA